MPHKQLGQTCAYGTPNAARNTRACPLRLRDGVASHVPPPAPRSGRLTNFSNFRYAGQEILSRYDALLMGRHVLYRGTAYLLWLGLVLYTSTQSICAVLCHLGVCCSTPVEAVAACHACERQATASTSGAQCCIEKLQLARRGEVRFAGKSASIDADAALADRTWLMPTVSEKMTASRTVSAPEPVAVGVDIRANAPRAPPVVWVEHA